MKSYSIWCVTNTDAYQKPRNAGGHSHVVTNIFVGQGSSHSEPIAKVRCQAHARSLEWDKFEVAVSLPTEDQPAYTTCLWFNRDTKEFRDSAPPPSKSTEQVREELQLELALKP